MKCAEESSNRCSVGKKERSLVGTWVSFEIFQGFRMWISHVASVWHFDTISDQFFKGYVDNFLKIKEEASGYPSWCQLGSEKEKFIRDYEKTTEGVRLYPSSIKKILGERPLLKLAQCEKRNILVNCPNILI